MMTGRPSILHFLKLPEFRHLPFMSIGGGTFSGKGGGGTPSQGRIEEIFRAATIYHCGSSLYIPIFKIPRILASVFAWRPFFLDLLDFLVYPGFAKSAKRGPRRHRTVSVNVLTRPKRDLGADKGTPWETQKIFCDF